MTKADLEQQIQQLTQQEQQHRILAERTVGARQALDHLLKGMTDEKAALEFPKAVPSVDDATGTA
jgi:hypothetical protein